MSEMCVYGIEPTFAFQFIINVYEKIYFDFRTSVRNKQDIKRIEALFVQFPQIDKWHVDLENWEKVLRIECREMISAAILNALQTIHIYAKELE